MDRIKSLFCFKNKNLFTKSKTLEILFKSKIRTSISSENTLNDICKNFKESSIPEKPQSLDSYLEKIDKTLISHSVNISSPSFVGHMTSSQPSFLTELSALVTGLNQNVNKVETSKSFTYLEKQTVAMMHKLTYENEESYYEKCMHDVESSLGSICSGGTIANITALWAARNQLLKPTNTFSGVDKAGMCAALDYYNFNGIAIIVSERAHFSIKKAADILGIGSGNVISIATDERNKIIIPEVCRKIDELKKNRIGILSIIGIAGTTETGNIDPLNSLADIAHEHQCHFHVDAAWGGASLFSKKYRTLFEGIDRADSVAIDGHKQMYTPIGTGIILFKNSKLENSIKYHSNYVSRLGSQDLGIKTIEGSRPSNSLFLHSCLHIIGRSGYEKLIDNSIENAKRFSILIECHKNFELTSKPELCILTYRYNPHYTQDYLNNCNQIENETTNNIINEITIKIHGEQSKKGNSFVSRTSLNLEKYNRSETIVFRVVLANPLTTIKTLVEILNEQETIAKKQIALLNKLKNSANNSHQKTSLTKDKDYA